MKWLGASLLLSSSSFSCSLAVELPFLGSTRSDDMNHIVHFNPHDTIGTLYGVLPGTKGRSVIYAKKNEKFIGAINVENSVKFSSNVEQIDTSSRTPKWAGVLEGAGLVQGSNHTMFYATDTELVLCAVKADGVADCSRTVTIKDGKGTALKSAIAGSLWQPDSNAAGVLLTITSGCTATAYTWDGSNNIMAFSPAVTVKLTDSTKCSALSTMTYKSADKMINSLGFLTTGEGKDLKNEVVDLALSWTGTDSGSLKEVKLASSPRNTLDVPANSRNYIAHHVDKDVVAFSNLVSTSSKAPVPAPTLTLARKLTIEDAKVTSVYLGALDKLKEGLIPKPIWAKNQEVNGPSSPNCLEHRFGDKKASPAGRYHLKFKADKNIEALNASIKLHDVDGKVVADLKLSQKSIVYTDNTGKELPKEVTFSLLSPLAASFDLYLIIDRNSIDVYTDFGAFTRIINNDTRINAICLKNESKDMKLSLDVKSTFATLKSAQSGGAASTAFSLGSALVTGAAAAALLL